jgi:hypothetical protein
MTSAFVSAGGGDWATNPENPEYKDVIQRELNTLIIDLPSFIECFGIFEVSEKGSTLSKPEPGLSCCVVSANHACNIMDSIVDSNPKNHVEAQLMFRPMEDTDTWCSFERVSNSEGVAQLAYNEFIEVILKYFIKGGGPIHPNHVEQLLYDV